MISWFHDSFCHQEPEETKPSEDAPTKRVVRKGRKGHKRAKKNDKPTVVETPEQVNTKLNECIMHEYAPRIITWLSALMS